MKIVPVDPFVLAAKLGVDITNTDGRKSSTASASPSQGAGTEPVDLDAHPQVAEELGKDAADRSKDTHRIIAACMDDGLTLEQARWVINQRPDLAERIAEFFARTPPVDDVLRSWEKLRDERFQVVQSLGQATGNSQTGATGTSQATATSQATGTSQGAGSTPAAPPPNPNNFFNKAGLKARFLADTVMSSVACGFGYPDQRFYTYDSGVWALNTGRIEAEVARLLGNRYRSSHTHNVLDLIRYSPNTAVVADNPLADYVNVPNGMLEWRTGDLLAHSPDYRSTVQLPVEYDPKADCPLFEKFIAEVLPLDLYTPTTDSPGFVWELIGYTLYSGNPLHVAILLYGKGRNGKGTLIRVLKALLGDRNCSTVGLHQLLENRFRAATLFGKLANLAGDLDAKWLDSTALFKAITGNDTIQAENKYGMPFDFTPWALPFYSINKAFGSADSSEGWVARWTVVPFPTSFLGREDRTLDDKLTSDAELRGILRRGIEALPVLMTRGRFIEPQSLTDAKEAFVVASDVVRAWLNECCVVNPDPGAKLWTPRKDLYRAYRLHTFTDGSKTLSGREFYNRIEQVNGIGLTTRQGVRGFAGVKLAPVVAPMGATP